LESVPGRRTRTSTRGLSVPAQGRFVQPLLRPRRATPTKKYVTSSGSQPDEQARTVGV
jgi:hypothetical protein